MGHVLPEIMIYALQVDQHPLRYSPKQLSKTLKLVATEEDQETFARLVEAYVSFAKGIKENKDLQPDVIETGALENIAQLSSFADLGRDPQRVEELAYARFLQKPTSYGPTMKAFVKFMGKNGFEIVQTLWPEKIAEATKLDETVN